MLTQTQHSTCSCLALLCNADWCLNGSFCSKNCLAAYVPYVSHTIYTPVPCMCSMSQHMFIVTYSSHVCAFAPSQILILHHHYHLHSGYNI